jgi:hypothetical protein
VYSHAYCTLALCLYTENWFVYTTAPLLSSLLLYSQFWPSFY